MNYRTAKSDAWYRYRVRILTPSNEKFDEYIVATSKEEAKNTLLAKYGDDHKALVLDQEPGKVGQGTESVFK